MAKTTLPPTPESSTPARGERRAHCRFAEAAEIVCQEIAYPLGQTPERPARMVDVSEGGVRLETPAAFAPGTLLQVALLLPGWRSHAHEFCKHEGPASWKPLTAVGRVVRCTPRGEGVHEVGVQFVDIWDDHWDAMREYLRRRET